MKKRLFILTLLFFISGNIQSQINITLPKYNDWFVDIFGNIIISTSNGLYKFDDKGKQIAKWNCSTISPITSFDARNALRIVVFHRDTYKISLLDGNLIEINSSVNLNLLGLIDIVAVCGSSTNGFWIVDAQKQELFHIQPNQTINHTTSLHGFLNASEVVKITEYDRNLWILTETDEWFVFDMFGNYLTKHVQSGLKTAQISKNPLTFVSDNRIYMYNSVTKEVQDTGREVVSALGAFIFNQNLFLFELEGASIVPLNH